MAHEIEGNNAFFLRTPAWHKLGVVLNDAPSVEEACKLMYPHELIDMPLVAQLDDLSVPVTSHKLIMRDDGKQIAVVGEGYTYPQPAQCLEFFSEYIESGLVELESGGSLCDGRKLWTLARVKDSEQEIKGSDTAKLYFLVYTSFDGSTKHGIQSTPIRVVCANTLAMAISDSKASTTHTFKHTRSIHQKIEQVRQNVSFASEQFRESLNNYRSLANKQLNSAKIEQYIRDVLDIPDIKEQTTRANNIVQRVLELHEHNPDYAYVSARGTAWGAYNAVSEYMHRDYGRSDDSRLNALWFGTNKNVNQKALNMAMAIN